jgi:hypothetical protein
MKIAKKIETNEETKKPRFSKLKENVFSLALITCCVLNPGCKIRNTEDLQHEEGKKQMVESLSQRENFSRLLYQNIETINGKKYVLIRNLDKGIIDYETEFKKNNFFDTGLKNTGEPYLTANNTYAYVTFENNERIALIDTKNNKAIAVKFDEPQTNISMAAHGDGLYFYSKESGLMWYDKEFKIHERIGEKQIEEMEGRSENLFLNMSSRGLMIIGDEFSSIYFINKKGTKVTLTKLNLKGYDEVIENPTIVEYNKHYYIKPANQDNVLEFDYNGNFKRKMEIPDLE